MHLQLLSSYTSYGLKIRRWVVQTSKILTKENNIQGTDFCQDNGNLLKSESMDMEFKHQLERIQLLRPALIPPAVSVSEDYSIYRSLRRGSVTRAKGQSVSDADLDLTN